MIAPPAVPDFHASATFLLLAQIAAIIAVSRLLGLFARRVHQPSVIAEVVAGIALGPSLLGVFWPEAKEALFPVSSLPVLGSVSQIGLVFFMFLVGLEFDPKLIEGRGRASLIISTSGIAVPFALSALLAVWAYPRLAPEGVPFLSFALFLGVAMSITAFPVLARILAESRMLRTQIGAITLACAAVADVTAWCILAFVVAVARATGIQAALWTTGLTAVFILLMLFGVRPLLLRLGVRSREGVSQNLVSVVFVLVFLAAMATEIIGIHALFGAFLLGAIMPRESEFAHELTQKIEDFVVVGILPLFFAVSGLRTQIGLVDSPERWIECGAIIAVACVGKFGGTALAARATGLGWRESSAAGVLMNTRGLMELIVLNIGLDLGVISPALFTMMVIMALVTTAMTSPLLHWLHKPGEDDEPDTVLTPMPERTAGRLVLLCVADPAIGPGMATLAAALQRGQPGTLLALRLLPAERTTVYLRSEVDEDEVEPLRLMEERGASLGVQIGTLSYVSTRPSEDICREAEIREAGLILLGFHRPLFTRTALGGVVRDVLEGAPSEVGVLVDRGLSRVQQILVTLDEGVDGRAALALAQRLAAGPDVRLRGLRVVEPGTPLERRPDDPPDTLVVATDDPTRALLHEAALGYDLVVVSLGEAWDLDPRPTPWHKEALVEEIPVSLLAVRARR